MNTKTIHLYINQYKKEFNRVNQQEIYKWKAVKQFQTNWDINAADFAKMLETSLKLAANLLDSNNTYPNKMICRNAEISPDFIRQVFVKLYDEETDLTERIKTFRAEIQSLNKVNFEGKNDYQGQRAVIVYLTLRYPERYFFYKFGMFKSFSEIIDYHYTPIKGRYENITQFLNLCDLIKSNLENDQELIKLHKERITPDCYFDKDLNILTQDFIYSVVRHLNHVEVDEKDGYSEVEITEVNSSDIELQESTVDFTPSTTNHIQNNIDNKRLGDLGEIWVVKYEKEKLLRSDKPRLAAKVEHTAKNFGDGAGYDVSSFDEDGNKMLIEVKTTKGSVNSVFYITRNELERSIKDSDGYFLYRLYDFKEKENSGKLLIIQGDMSSLCITTKSYTVKMKKPVGKTVYSK